MRALLESNTAHDLHIKGGLRYGTAKMSTTVTTSIAAALVEPVWWAFDPASTATQINMPPILGATIPMEGRIYRVANISTGTGNLTIKADTADGTGTLTVLGPGQAADLYVLNAAWLVDTAPNFASSNAAIAFYGATPVTQPTSSNEAAVATTAATSTTPWGFGSAAQANGIITLVNQLRADLVTLGLIKGS